MAKKRKKKIEKQQSTQQNNSTDFNKISKLTEFSNQDIESLKKYKPLNLSLKSHIILLLSIFAVILVLYATYIYLITKYSGEKVQLGVAFYKIGKSMETTDTDLVESVFYTEDYQILNEITHDINETIDSFEKILRTKEIEPKTKLILKDLEESIVKLQGIVQKQKDNQQDPVIKKFLSELLDLLAESKSSLKDINGVENIVNDFVSTQKLLMSVKDIFFEVQKDVHKMRGLWNYEAAYNTALSEFHEAIVLDHKNHMAFYWLGKYYTYKKEFDIAGDRYSMVFKLAPYSKEAKEIFSYYKAEEKKNSANSQILYDLGMAYMYRSDQVTAKTYFNKVIGKDTQLKSLLAYMANVRLKNMGSDDPQVVFDPRW